MVRPCVAREFIDPAIAVSHQCIRPLIGLLRGHHGYQRACELISGQALAGHIGHQCSQAPGRPNLHLVSLSRRPRHDRHSSAGDQLSATYAQLDRLDDARAQVAEMLQIDPSYAINRVPMVLTLRRPDDIEHLSNSLRKAGLPED